MNYKHGLNGHHLYSVWRNIKTRCYNPKTHNYENYGGKGITICPEWLNDVSVFYAWCVDNGYKEGLTLDRINSNFGYYPENCRWVTREFQAQNRGKRKNSSGYFLGVSARYWGGKEMYISHITHNKKRVYLGSHKTAEQAAKVRDQYIIDNNLIGFPLTFLKR